LGGCAEWRVVGEGIDGSPAGINQLPHPGRACPRHDTITTTASMFCRAMPSE
jgi:hypothetical protein